MACYRCGADVSFNEMGLNRKLVNRGIEKFLCLSCLAEHFHVTEDDLRTMAEHFYQAGCTLFTGEPIKTGRSEK